MHPRQIEIHRALAQAEFKEVIHLPCVSMEIKEEDLAVTKGNL